MDAPGEGAANTARRAAPRGRGGGEGATYLAFLAFDNGSNLRDMPGGYGIAGVRLPGLCEFLARTRAGAYWPFELRLLQSQMFGAEGLAAQEAAFVGALDEQPGDAATWGAYSDWLEDRGEPRAGLTVLRHALEAVCRLPSWRLDTLDPWRDYGKGPVGNAREEVRRRSKKVKDSRHDPAKSRVQVGSHVAQVSPHVDRWGRKDLHNRWVLFDDLWAAAQPDLAAAILRHAAGWDVLTVG